MALDHLDVIVIGADTEGLFAAAVLARAGLAVTVVERESETAVLGEGEDALMSFAAARALDLPAQGLRFAAAPAQIGVGGDRALVLWPDQRAAQAAIAAFSVRDAEALESFHARIARAARAASGQKGAVSAWLATEARDATRNDAMMFRATSLSRLLDEAFDHELVKGLWAQAAIMGTGVSPHEVGSGALLLRQSVLAAAAPGPEHRFVAGGKTRLRRTLLALLKFFNNADIRFGTEVKQAAVERDGSHAAVLSDGTTLRAPLVVSALTPAGSRDLLGGHRLAPEDLGSVGAVAPARVRFQIGALPKLAGIDANVIASGAVVRLNPSLSRLQFAHGRFRARMMASDPCLEFRIVPMPASSGKQGWTLYAAMPYVPATTVEGPWTGKRRDGLRALCVKQLDAVSPGFGASVEAAEVLHPRESETVMDPKGAAALTAKASIDLTGVPAWRGAGVFAVTKGFCVLERSVYAGDGDAGLAAAGLALNGRPKLRADA